MAAKPGEAWAAGEPARNLRLIRALSLSTDAVLLGIAYLALGRDDPGLFLAIAALLAGFAAGAWILLGRLIAQVEAGAGPGGRAGP